MIWWTGSILSEKTRSSTLEAAADMAVAVLLVDPLATRPAVDPLAQVDLEGREAAALMDAILPHQFMAHMTAQRFGRSGVSAMSI